MPQLFNRAGMSSNTAGTGTITLASALGAVAVNSASFQTFASAGVTDQTVVSYLILDSNGNWEVGTGTYTAAGTTLSRSPKFSSNGNAAISLSGTEQIFITALASDGGDVLGGTTTPLRGFDTPVNLSLTASTDGTILTVNVIGNNGGNPSPTNPVMIPFRDSNNALGDPVWRLVTSALSINTNSAGASLGSVANTAFRLWVCAFDDSGTVRLALINCSTATQIFPLVEGLVQSTTNMSGSATSAGVFYTPSTINLVSRPFRIIGYVEYSSTGLATPGTYTRVPDFMQLFGPGVKKPGDFTGNVKFVTTTSNDTGTTSTTYAAGTFTASITPTSAANLIRVYAGFVLGSSGGTNQVSARIQRGTSWTTAAAGSFSPAANPSNNTAVSFGIDLPNQTTSATYTIYRRTNNAATSVIAPQIISVNEPAGIMLEELMG